MTEMYVKTGVLFSVLIFLTPIIITPSAMGETILSIDPPIVTDLNIGDTFEINVTTSAVTDLYGWEFQLYYNSQVLNATQVTEGPFLKSGGSTFFYKVDWNDNYNVTHGHIHLTCCLLLPTVKGVTGSGTLATIGFKLKTKGQSTLHLTETILVDSSENEIPHTTVDGIVKAGIRDIAIINTTTSKTVTNDTIVYINVTADNQGEATETFNITLYYDANPIETKTVTDLSAETTKTLTFTWDTTPVPKGNYTISAKATPVPGEIDTADNTYTDGWITETILGDIDGNYEVNIVDISTIAAAYKSKPGDDRWEPNADLDNNEIINIIDIAQAAANFGKKDC